MRYVIDQRISQVPGSRISVCSGAQGKCSMHASEACIRGCLQRTPLIGPDPTSVGGPKIHTLRDRMPCPFLHPWAPPEGTQCVSNAFC